MAKIRVFIEMIVDHNALVEPHKFPTVSDLFDLGKYMLTSDITDALEEEGTLEEMFEYTIISE